MITQRKLKELLDYDPETGVFVHKAGKKGCHKGMIAGYVEANGYRRIHIDGGNYLAQRLAYLWIHGHMPKFVDHKDGDRDHNAERNLREATRSQNNMNSRVHSDKKNDLPKGVSTRTSGKYRASIQAGGKRHHLGTFLTVREASLAYAEASKKYHGEFATDRGK